MQHPLVHAALVIIALRVTSPIVMQLVEFGSEIILIVRVHHVLHPLVRVALATRASNMNKAIATLQAALTMAMKRIVQL